VPVEPAGGRVTGIATSSGAQAPPASAIPPEDDAQRLRAWVIVSIALLVLLIGAWLYRWMIDDAFIDLRIVRQIQAGHGPVFNAGERVEAATSPLWLWMLVAGDYLTPLPLEWIAVAGGIACTLLGVIAGCAGSSIITGPRRAGEMWLPIGVLVLAVLPPMWLTASTGLENGLVLAWLGACLWVLARWARGATPLGWAAAVLIGLGPLVRPETTLVSALLLLLVLTFEWRARSWGRRIGLAATALAAPVLYELFRMGYYGELTPNTALTKEATGSPYWSSGWTYFQHSVQPYWLWVPCLIIAGAVYAPLARRLAVEPTRRMGALVALFIVGGLLLLLFVISVGGDFMHFRLLAPGVFMVMAPVAVVPWGRAKVAALLLVPWAALSLSVFRSPDGAPAGIGVRRNAITLSAFYGGRLEWFDGRHAYYLETKLPGTPASGKSPSVAAYGIGALGYKLGTHVYVLDALGLADPMGSHLELEHRGFPGHEKVLPPGWIVARLTVPGSEVPQVLVSPQLLAPERNTTGVLDEPFAASVSHARRALECGDIAKLFDAARKPLTPGRFLSNLVHASVLWRVQVPPQPDDAVRVECPRQR
jgi:arabinofuranosyltransferase